MRGQAETIILSRLSIRRTGVPKGEEGPLNFVPFTPNRRCHAMYRSVNFLLSLDTLYRGREKRTLLHSSR